MDTSPKGDEQPIERAPEGQRHAPPLLPVQITSPTFTRTQRASRSVTKTRSVDKALAPAAVSCIEIVLCDERRIRLHGEAQRTVLARVLAWLPSNGGHAGRSRQSTTR